VVAVAVLAEWKGDPRASGSESEAIPLSDRERCEADRKRPRRRAGKEVTRESRMVERARPSMLSVTLSVAYLGGV